jgi:hypothetical protein
MKFNKKILKISFVFGLVSFILAYFGIYFSLKQLQKKSQEFAEMQNDFSYLSDRTSNILKIKKIYKDIEPDLEKVNNIFINPDVPIDFIRFLEKTSNDLNIFLNIGSISYKSDKTDTEKWNYMEFQINIAGSFSNILKFINKIENGFYLTEISNINIKKLTEQEIASQYKNLSSDDVASNITIKVFTKK